jgi:hypothetical protein
MNLTLFTFPSHVIAADKQFRFISVQGGFGFGALLTYKLTSIEASLAV